MEKEEHHIMEVFKEEKSHEDAIIEFCQTRTKLCSDLDKRIKQDKTEKDEL